MSGETRRRLEALLFAQTAPSSAEQIALWLGIEPDRVPEAIAQLSARLEQSGSALVVHMAGGGYLLSTSPDLDSFLTERLRLAAPEPLSAAAWEVLAVVAYRQPITRLEVEAVRQVNSEKALDTLVNRELIGQVGRKEAPGRPILYGTTSQFLKEFGLNAIEQLPEVKFSSRT